MAHRIFHQYSPYVALLLFVCLLLPTSIEKNSTLVGEDSESYEEKFFKEYSECTTGLASCSATPDGRPLLWKNRDVGNGRQEYHYKGNTPIPFIGLTYAGDETEYYAGLNANGFAIENSDATNLPGDNSNGNGWGWDPDDGEVMYTALATCTTVDDFQKLLDSLIVDGLTWDSNYGTFDAFGGAAMFETDGYKYYRWDAAECPGGWLVRSNYSYSGTSGLNWNGYSAYRHNRAFELWKKGYEANNLTPQYLYSTVIRDINSEGVTNYAIPYDGYYQGNYGFLPNGDAICRSSTRSVMVAQGVTPGQRADDGIVWAMVGNPIGGIAVPLWVRAGSTPLEFNNPDDWEYARLCGVSRNWESWIASWNGVDTRKLRNAEGTGYWDFTIGLESWIYQKTQRFISSPSFRYDQLGAFQNTLAKLAADSLENWSPPCAVSEIAEPVFQGGDIVIAWGEGNDPPPPTMEGKPIQGYNVYRSSEPFREGLRGEKIGSTKEKRFIDAQPPEHLAFYRIEAFY